MEYIGIDVHKKTSQVCIRTESGRPRCPRLIIGAKREEQLRDDSAATEVTLSDDQVKKLDEVSALPREYPGWMLEMQSSGRRGDVSD